MKKNDRRKDKQEGGVRVPIPRPGGPMKDKKKYNRKNKTLSDEQKEMHERTSCNCPEYRIEQGEL